MLNVFILLILSILGSSFGKTVKELDKMCDPSEPCTRLADCPSSSKSVKDLILKTKKSKDYKQLAKSMKELVCNKKEKAVCCPPDEDKGRTQGETLIL